MKCLGRFVSYIILAVNIAVIILLLLSAYSSYVSPARFPVWSCMGLVYIIFFILNICFLIVWLVVRPMFMFFPIAGVLLTWGAFTTVLPINRSEKAPENAIKVLSYNVMGFRWQQADKDSDRNRIVKYIEDSGADIVCIQEYILSDRPTHLSDRDVESRLSDYRYHKEIRVGNRKNPNKLACFSKYPIIEAKRIKYSSMYNGSAIFKLLVGKDTVILINNHLESNKLTKEDKDTYQDIINSSDADKVKSGIRSLAHKLADAASTRSEQARIVARTIREYRNKPVIVCGDFNDGPLSYAHRTINNGITDAFTERGAGLGISYNQNNFYFRIDNIMVNDFWNVHSCKVDNSINDSDHYPVIAEISLVKE